MKLKNKERVERSLLTLHGTVRYSRTILVPADHESKARLYMLFHKKSVCPVDEALEVDGLGFKATVQAMSRIAKEATKAHSYEDAAIAVEEFFGEKVSLTRIKSIASYVGMHMLDEQYKEAAEARGRLETEKYDARKIRRQSDDILYGMTDGAMVHVRDKEHIEMTNAEIAAERAALEKEGGNKTAGGAEAAEKKDGHEDAWAESKHAICFHARDIKYYYEDADGNRKAGRLKDVLDLRKELEEGNKEIKGLEHKIESRDCIGYIGPVSEFQCHFLALAERNGWRYCSKFIILGDGATWIRNMKETFFNKKNVIQILDLYHALENGGKFIDYVKADASPEEKEKYRSHILGLVRNGKVNELLEELKEYEGRKMPAGVPNLYTYILNNKDNMDYPAYIAAGYFVGSGAMESANIYMMQDRMKLPGMRWPVENGRQMLCLKSLYASRKWEKVDARLLELAKSQMP